MKRILATAIAAWLAASAAGANVRVTNTTGEELLIEIRCLSLRPEKFTLDRRATNSDFSSFGNTTVIVRSPQEPENNLCTGVYPPGTALLLEKRSTGYRLVPVVNPPTER